MGNNIKKERISVTYWFEDGWWIARLKYRNGSGITQGKDQAELFRMIADSMATMEGVRYPWWKRLISRWLKI
ncbi:MAG: hypothetical protein WC455_10310 [Dehalococcoidia bacterium]|jgi:hypothetical protein